MKPLIPDSQSEIHAGRLVDCLFVRALRRGGDEPPDLRGVLMEGHAELLPVLGESC